MNLQYFIQFYIVLLILNISVLPLCYKIFKEFGDGGYIYGKVIGLYLSGYLMWLFSSIGILKFSIINCIICTIIIMFSIYSCFYIKYRTCIKQFVTMFKGKILTILAEEILFCFIFVVFLWIFAHRIPAHETERMMDVGFMMSLSKTEYMPPLDIWASGKDINYYYFGQYIMTFITKLSNIPVGYGYTFGLYMIPAYACIAIWRLVYEMTHSTIASFISNTIVVFSANLHYVVMYMIVPAVWDILRISGDKPSYWFANSTRYIGYVPDVENDKTIHEFPSYSFIIGDLHAHVINMLIVVTILAVLWVVWKKVIPDFNKQNIFDKQNIIKSIKYWGIIGFLLGVASMSNYWDLPIYYVVSGAIILFGSLYYCKLCRESVLYVAFAGIFIWVVNVIIALPFNVRFEKMVQGIRLVQHRSMIYQLLLLWGFPVILFVCYVCVFLKKKKINDTSLFVLLLGLCACGLVILPEVIYVKDIYEAGFPRANTMFKLSYQAFIIFGIISGYIIWFFHENAKKETGYQKYVYHRIAMVSVIIAALTASYFYTSVNAWIKDFSSDNFKGFDANYSIILNSGEEYDAINSLIHYVEEHNENQPVVLQADGDSYTDSCFVSVLSGYPTILGWHTHEWLWRDSYEFYNERETIVKDIYTSDNEEYVEQLLDLYNVDYIYIGQKEYDKYDVVQNGVLESLGDIVYSKFNDSNQLIEIIHITK